MALSLTALCESGASVDYAHYSQSLQISAVMLVSRSPSSRTAPENHFFSLFVAFSAPVAHTVLAHRVPQVCTSFACGAAGAAQLWKWRRGDATVRAGAWRLYGWYCGLACAGCVAGGVGWIGFFLFNKIDSDANHDWYIAVETMRVATNNSLAWHDVLSLEQQYEARYLSWSVANQWYAVFFVFYPVEVLCVSIAKLMTVDRLAVFQRVFDATVHAKDAVHATQRKRIFRLQLSVTFF
jgi:hypothetical protein